MNQASCPNPSCARAFTTEQSGSAPCPTCGSAGVVILDIAATVDSPPANPRQGDERAAVLDLPAASPAASGSTLDLPGSADTASVPGPALPTSIGRFRVVARLGAGAFGEVFRCHDPQLDREVALKVARSGTLDSPERVGRFLREARAAANLRHPHIVPVFDSGQDGERHFIATGFIDGRTLEAEIAEAGGKPLDLKRATGVVRKLAEALGYAHRQGVVHRDVKPANVLVDRAGEPALTDFGLAVRAGDEAVKTQDGRVMGTPAYMSPEQAAGRSAEATAASDQYALGVMLYEMATGRRPFDGPVEVVVFNHVQTEPRRPRSENRAVPRDLETVILKCLEKDPRKRYPSCEGLAEDLRRFLEGEPVTARRVGPVERLARWARRKPTAAATYGLSALALSLGGVILLVVGLWKTAEGAKAEAESARDDLKVAVSRTEQALRGEEAAKREVERQKDRVARLEYGRAIQIAYQAWRDNKLTEARAILAETREDLRGWEWHFIHRLCHAALLDLPAAGLTSPMQIGYTPDGERLVVSGIRFVRVWDAASGHVVLDLPASDRVASRPLPCAFASPDRSQVLGFATDGTARFWDVRTGQPGTALKGKFQGGPYTLLAFSPTGTQVAVVLSVPGRAAPARVWDTRTGDMIHELTGNAGPITSLEYSLDGARLAAVADDGTARIWNTATGARVQTLTLKPDAGTPSPTWAQGCAFTPDGTRLVTTWAEVVRVWDAETGQPIHTFKGYVGRSAFNRDGSRMVTSYGHNQRVHEDAKIAHVWDTATWKQTAELRSSAHIMSVEFSPDGSRILTTGSSGYGTTELWDAATGKLLNSINGYSIARGTHVVSKFTMEYRSPAFTPDGTRIVIASSGTIKVWDTATGEPFAELKGHLQPMFASAAFSPQGTHLVSACSGEIKVWDVTTDPHFQTIARIGGLFGGGAAAEFTSGGTRIVTWGAGPTQFWQTETGRRVLVLGPERAVTPLAALSPDGGLAVTVGFSQGDTSACVWDTRTGEMIHSFGEKKKEFNGGAAFAPNGELLVTCLDGSARVWDVATWKQVACLTDTEGAPQGRIADVSFSSDGSRLLARDGASRALRVWDVAGWKPLFDVPGGVVARYGSSVFNRDGSQLVTISRDRQSRYSDTAVVWDIATGRQLRQFTGSGEVSLAGFRPSGTELVTIETENLVTRSRLWEVNSGTQLGEFRGSLGTHERVVSPDGRRLITNTQDGLRLYDATSGVLLLALPFSGVGFSPDGTQILATRGTTVGLCDSRPRNRAFLHQPVAPSPRAAKPE